MCCVIGTVDIFNSRLLSNFCIPHSLSNVCIPHSCVNYLNEFNVVQEQNCKIANYLKNYVSLTRQWQPIKALNVCVTEIACKGTKILACIPHFPVKQSEKFQLFCLDSRNKF